MSEFDSVVSVTITSATAAITQANFGIPAIAGGHSIGSDLVQEFSSLASLSSAGFTSATGIYKAASAILAQNPRVTSFKVIKLSENHAQTIKIVPIAANSVDYDITIGGEEFSITSDGSATVAEICTALTTEINTGTGAFTATDNTTYVSVAADVAGATFVYQDYNLARLKLTDITATTTTLSADLDAAILVDSDWYGLTLVNQCEADINAGALWIEANERVMTMNSGDFDVQDASSTTDIASDLQGFSYARTVPQYHKNIGEFSGAAWMGKMFPYQNPPGQATWKFKTLAGISTDILTETQINALEDKNCNYYKTTGGAGTTYNGIAADGSFIDNTIGVDWIRARLRERIFGLLKNNLKIPYTDAGVNLVVAEVKAQLDDAINAGILAANPAPTVTAPKVADISDNDKANRILPDIEFTATTAGAIHSVVINGIISL